MQKRPTNARQQSPSAQCQERKGFFGHKKKKGDPKKNKKRKDGKRNKERGGIGKKRRKKDQGTIKTVGGKSSKGGILRHGDGTQREKSLNIFDGKKPQYETPGTISLGVFETGDNPPSAGRWEFSEINRSGGDHKSNPNRKSSRSCLKISRHERESVGAVGRPKKAA